MPFEHFLFQFYRSYHEIKHRARVRGESVMCEGDWFACQLRYVRPDLADRLYGSAIDSHGDVEVRSATWAWVEAHWGLKHVADLDGDGPWAAVADVPEEVVDACLG